MNINKLVVEGDENIVLQDITDAIINIGIDEGITKFIESLQVWHEEEHPNTLNIIVLSTTQNRLNSLIEDDHKPFMPLEFHDDEIHKWKPFTGEKSILELLGEYLSKSGFKIDAYFIDEMALNPGLISHFKDDISPNTILILDCLALYCPTNKIFAKIFDETNIGGCIVPIDQNHSEKIKKVMVSLFQKTFSHLHECFWNRLKKEYMHIELEVPSKNSLFRRLTNIAIKKLGLKQLKVAWSSDLDQYKNDANFNDQNSSL